MSKPSTYRDKDDLGRPRPLSLNADSNWHSSLRFRRKRRTVFIFFSICTIIYLLLHSRWWNDVLLLADGPPSDHPGDLGTPPGPSGDREFSSAPASHNAVPVDASMKPRDPNISKFSYNGPIRFLGLYETLYKIQQYSFRLQNRHVVFVAANMNTASIIAGIACEMSQIKRNMVHLALVGRNELSIEFFKKANGLAGEGCGVVVHDGRPDYASISTDDRMGLSLKNSLKYMRDYFSPTVFISDADREPLWFQDVIARRAKELGATHIKLPKDVSTIPWLQKLDAASLAAWHKPSIDIVIHADAHSGQLVRLLKSLKNANYFTADLPRLFIDLDPDTDKSIRDFVNGFTWPSKDRLFVRHRIFSKADSFDDNPIAFTESYYPNSPDSAVLYLSPNIELSPFYFHFLFYALLEYKYSNAQPGLDKNLIYGISLDTPLRSFTGEYFPSSQLTTQSSTSDSQPSDQEELTPFFYAAPSHHATLFFGNHWRLLHLYLAKRLDKAYTQNVDYSLPTPPSKFLPSWIKYYSEILTAGGYVMLYPNYEPSESLVVYHTEKKGGRGATRDEKSVMRVNNVLNLLPEGKLPLWSDMPMLGMDGKKTKMEQLLEIAREYKKEILGQCEGVKKDDGVEDSVDDLFCGRDEVVMAKRKKEAEVREKEEETKRAEKERAEAAQIAAERQANLDPNANIRRLPPKKIEGDQEAVPHGDTPNVMGEGAGMPNHPTAMKLEEKRSDEGHQDDSQESTEKSEVDQEPAKADEGGQNLKPKVIPNKIVSLDDLERVPVEINGEKIIAQSSEDKAVPKYGSVHSSRKRRRMGGENPNADEKSVPEVQPAGDKIPPREDENNV
ncbi:hypothetical protein TWF694_001243 [Orbilia ellipsospora]|uniref:Glycosyltransferase family 71 protein n=1 Tax=Orbilia ellipsospora TaxID=2528407 RepID=A0AAV9XR89_9PEZI